MESFLIGRGSGRFPPKTTCFLPHALESRSAQCHWSLFDQPGQRTHEVGQTLDQDVELEFYLLIQGLAV